VSKKFFVVSLVLCLMLIPIFSGIALAAPPHNDNLGEVITLSTPQGEVDIYKKLSLGDWPKYNVESKGPKPHAVRGKLGEALPEGGRRYAIVAGISNYPGGDLDIFYAADDAEAISSILTNLYDFDEVTCLVNENATRDAILNAIEYIEEQENENDEVVFYFSGHGAKLTSAGKGQVGIITWGSEDPEPFPEFISDKDLKTAFKDFETDRVIFIFDSCLAGGMIDIGRKGNVISMASTQNGYAIEYGEAYSYYGLGQIYVPGVGYTWMNHGLFTYYFAVCGLELGLADFYDHDEDGVIMEQEDVTIEEAFDYTRLNMEELSNFVPELWLIPTIGDRFRNDLLP